MYRSQNVDMFITSIDKINLIPKMTKAKSLLVFVGGGGGLQANHIEFVITFQFVIKALRLI